MLQGFVISDWQGIDHLSIPYGSNYHHCISSSINAGIDMVDSELQVPKACTIGCFP